MTQPTKRRLRVLGLYGGFITVIACLLFPPLGILLAAALGTSAGSLLAREIRSRRHDRRVREGAAPLPDAHRYNSRRGY